MRSFRLDIVLNNDHYFIECAPETPDVWGLVILSLQERDFRSSVPPGSNMTRQGALLVFRFVFDFDHLIRHQLFNFVLCDFLLFNHLLNWISDSQSVSAPRSGKILRKGPSEPEVTKLYLGLGVDQDVGWLDVPVHDIGGVKELERAKQIVHHHFNMLFGQIGLVSKVQKFP